MRCQAGKGFSQYDVSPVLFDEHFIIADLYTVFQFCSLFVALAYLANESYLNSVELHLKYYRLRTISSCVMYSSSLNVPIDLSLLNTKKEQSFTCLDA